MRPILQEEEKKALKIWKKGSKGYECWQIISPEEELFTIQVYQHKKFSKPFQQEAEINIFNFPSKL